MPEIVFPRNKQGVGGQGLYLQEWSEETGERAEGAKGRL